MFVRNKAFITQKEDNNPTVKCSYDDDQDIDFFIQSDNQEPESNIPSVLETAERPSETDSEIEEILSNATTLSTNLHSRFFSSACMHDEELTRSLQQSTASPSGNSN